MMTVIVIIGAAYFLVRRTRPAGSQIRHHSIGLRDSGHRGGTFCHRVPGLPPMAVNYPLMMGLHVLAGDIMLAAIPFTRLSHMLFSPFTRAYMGSEFGKAYDTPGTGNRPRVRSTSATAVFVEIRRQL
jgi:hypothetical protein